MQGRLSPHTPNAFGAAAPQGLLTFLLVLPWVHPWAPGPQSNTVPLLISWACLALLLVWGRLPSALDLARAWAIAAVLSSLMGLVQYFGQAPHLGGWVHVPAYLGDAVGNLRQRNQLATLTTLGAVSLLWWHSQGLRARHALPLLALLAMGNAATGSRTGLLQWLALPVLLLIWQRGQARRPWAWSVLLGGLAVFVLASVLLPALLSLASGGQVSAALSRMGDVSGCGARGVLWRNVLHLIAQQPWSGWGWGELKYAHYISDYPGERFCDILGNAHNLPLHLAVELGLPVAISACLATLTLLLRAHPWRLVRASDSLAWGVLMAIGLHSLLEYPLWYGPFQLAALWAVLLLWPSAAHWPAAQQRLVSTVAAVSLCLIALIGFDHQRMRQIFLPSTQRLALWQADPWGAARQTWFFRRTVDFAELSATEASPDNASAMLASSERMLHYSPEPRVVQRLIDSARLLGREELAQWHTQQLQRVYGQQARGASAPINTR
ncbi:MAG: polymerase [Betaproteobacteria bacterium]|nr:polymerase [Betaproteobacteria bacterium]